MNHSSQSHTIQVLQITDGGELRDVRNMENISFFTSCVKQRLSKDSYNRSLWSTTPCKTLNLEEVHPPLLLQYQTCSLDLAVCSELWDDSDKIRTLSNHNFYLITTILLRWSSSCHHQYHCPSHLDNQGKHWAVNCCSIKITNSCLFPSWSWSKWPELARHLENVCYGVPSHDQLPHCVLVCCWLFPLLRFFMPMPAPLCPLLKPRAWLFCFSFFWPWRAADHTTQLICKTHCQVDGCYCSWSHISTDCQHTSTKHIFEWVLFIVA